MKNTKYLFDTDKHSLDGTVSVSQLQTFMSCPKKWEYNYVQNLTPRVERAYLSIGKLCHKGMQTAMQYKWEHEREIGYSREHALKDALIAIDGAWYEYVSQNSFLDEEIPDIEQMLRDAKSVFTQAFWEFDIDKYEVLTLYKNSEPIPALELHFIIPCKNSKGLHGYIDAILKDKETGHVWCTDYKFRKSLSPDEDESFNIQNAVYSYACEKMGVKITGTMTWQHTNTPVSDPQILKNGGVSRAKIRTTWEHYEQFCVNYGIDPAPYEDEMKDKLSDIEWYRPTYEYRNEITIHNMWTEVIEPCALKVKNAWTSINSKHLYPWNCKMCQYQSICQGELRDYDVDAIILREYYKRG